MKIGKVMPDIVSGGCRYVAFDGGTSKLSEHLRKRGTRRIWCLHWSGKARLSNWRSGFRLQVWVDRKFSVGIPRRHDVLGHDGNVYVSLHWFGRRLALDSRPSAYGDEEMGLS